MYAITLCKGILILSLLELRGRVLTDLCCVPGRTANIVKTGPHSHSHCTPGHWRLPPETAWNRSQQSTDISRRTMSSVLKWSETKIKRCQQNRHRYHVYSSSDFCHCISVSICDLFTRKQLNDPSANNTLLLVQNHSVSELGTVSNAVAKSCTVWAWCSDPSSTVACPPHTATLLPTRSQMPHHCFYWQCFRSSIICDTVVIK